MTDIPLLN